MAVKEIKIREDEEYITLNVLLKITDFLFRRIFFPAPKS